MDLLLALLKASPSEERTLVFVAGKRDASWVRFFLLSYGQLDY